MVFVYKWAMTAIAIKSRIINQLYITMKDKEKIEAILSLLTDKNVGFLISDGQLEGKEEEFGALVFAGSAFKQAYQIANS